MNPLILAVGGTIIAVLGIKQLLCQNDKTLTTSKNCANVTDEVSDKPTPEAKPDENVDATNSDIDINGGGGAE